MKLVRGFGINDLKDHTTTIEERFVDSHGKSRRRKIWECPYYKTWQGMIQRCYAGSERSRNETYIDKTICEEWRYFSKFKQWMESQNWINKTLDKDILVDGNKVYGPDTCVFVSQEVNKFVLERVNRDGLTGASWNPKKGKYICAIGAGCGSGKTIHVGAYDTEEAAHRAWLRAKLKRVEEMKDDLDIRVYEALIKRYTKRLHDRPNA